MIATLGCVHICIVRMGSQAVKGEGSEGHSSSAASAGEAWDALWTLSMGCTHRGTGITLAGWDVSVSHGDAPPVGRAALNNPAGGAAFAWKCLSILTGPVLVSSDDLTLLLFTFEGVISAIRCSSKAWGNKL